MYISLKNIISTNLIKNHNMSAHTAALNEFLVKRKEGVFRNVCIRERNKRLQESDCVKWLKKRFKSTANSKYGLFEEESHMIKEVQFLLNKMSNAGQEIKQEKQTKIVKLKQLENIFKKYEVKGVDTTISEFFAKRDSIRNHTRNGLISMTGSIERCDASSTLPDLQNHAIQTPKAVNIRTLVELCMDENLKPICGQALDEDIELLSPIRRQSKFRPTNLKTALHYVYFKDKRDKILNSINELNKGDDINPELGTKFALLFRNDLVKPGKYKRINLSRRVKAKKRMSLAL